MKSDKLAPLACLNSIFTIELSLLTHHLSPNPKPYASYAGERHFHLAFMVFSLRHNDGLARAAERRIKCTLQSSFSRILTRRLPHYGSKSNQTSQTVSTASR